MIDTETLRKKVIDLAIQGKLTEQLPSDGDAETLYVQILDHKSLLIKEGKIKKDKELPEIAEEEIPFYIPDNWKWVRIGDVTYNHGQKTPQNRFCYIDVGTLDNVNHKLNDNENIFEAKDAPSRAKKIVEEGDILYSTVRPYLHNICVVDKEFSYEPIASTAFAVMHTYDNCLLNGYLFYWLLSEWFDKYANGDSLKGTLYPAIGEKDFFKGLMPMPPFEEQKRILSIIDDVVRITSEIDDLQTKYSNDLVVLKNKIIYAGIKGKLTKQLPEDGDAETLYAQILDYKSQMIKEGKIKKEKPLPDITADEIPFEIPKNWKWVRLGAVLREVIVPQRDKPKQFDGDIPWCRIEDADGDYMSKSHSNQNVSRKTVEEMNLRVFPTGTILSACSGASIGRILITTTELCTNQTFNGLVCSSGLYNRYLFHYLKKSIGKLKKMGSGAAMEYVSQKKTNEMLLPLPPYAEQKRIVATVEKVLQIVGY